MQTVLYDNWNTMVENIYFNNVMILVEVVEVNFWTFMFQKSNLPAEYSYVVFSSLSKSNNPRSKRNWELMYVSVAFLVELRVSCFLYKS